MEREELKARLGLPEDGDAGHAESIAANWLTRHRNDLSSGGLPEHPQVLAALVLGSALAMHAQALTRVAAAIEAYSDEGRPL